MVSISEYMVEKCWKSSLRMLFQSLTHVQICALSLKTLDCQHEITHKNMKEFQPLHILPYMFGICSGSTVVHVIGLSRYHSKLQAKVARDLFSNDRKRITWQPTCSRLRLRKGAPSWSHQIHERTDERHVTT